MNIRIDEFDEDESTVYEPDAVDDFLEDYSHVAVSDALERKLDSAARPRKPGSMSERFLKELIVRQRRRKARRQAAAESLLDEFVRSSSQVSAVDDKMSGLLTSYLREETESCSVTRPSGNEVVIRATSSHSVSQPIRPVVPEESVEDLLRVYVTGQLPVVPED